MRFLALVLVLLVAGLLAEDLLDSAIGAWAAFGAVLALVAWRVAGSFGPWPGDEHDEIGDGD